MGSYKLLSSAGKNARAQMERIVVAQRWGATGSLDQYDTAITKMLTVLDESQDARWTEIKQIIGASDITVALYGSGSHPQDTFFTPPEVHSEFSASLAKPTTGKFALVRLGIPTFVPEKKVFAEYTVDGSGLKRSGTWNTSAFPKAKKPSGLRQTGLCDPVRLAHELGHACQYIGNPKWYLDTIRLTAAAQLASEAQQQAYKEWGLILMEELNVEQNEWPISLTLHGGKRPYTTSGGHNGKFTSALGPRALITKMLANAASTATPNVYLPSYSKAAVQWAHKKAQVGLGTYPNMT